MNIKTSRSSGFTLIEIMIVVAVIGLLAGISTPRFIKARDTSQLNAIINNLRIIEESKDAWALESRKGGGALPVDTDLADFFKGYTMPTPVVGETYNINAVGTAATATLPATVTLGTVPAGGDVTLP
jgi:prepilin-type N-terminal cleavage/methylation domain-containing protein